MSTRRVKSDRCIKSMNPKNKTKSPIHENADANITSDFGEGDITRIGVGFHTDTRPATYIVTSVIFRYS